MSSPGLFSGPVGTHTRRAGRGRSSIALGTMATSLALAGPVPAEVVSSGESGFVTKASVLVRVAPAAAYARFVDIGSWWDPAHSYSQDGKRMSLKAEPGGCFCESLESGGFVEHLRVIFVEPGKILRLQGGLGPLQEMGAAGTMSVKFEQAGTETRVTLSYMVTAFLPGRTATEIAGPVDGVLQQQLQRFQRSANGG